MRDWRYKNMSRENRPSPRDLKFSAPDDLPVVETFETESPKLEESQETDPRVETALQAYQATLKETGDKEAAQKKSWDKLVELTQNDITDTEPFDKLAEKMDQAADTPEVKPRELENELPISDKDSAADAGVPPLENPPVAEGSFLGSEKPIPSDKPTEMLKPQEEEMGRHEIKAEETEVVIAELNDSKEKAEILLRDPGIAPADREKLQETLGNLKLGISMISEPGTKDEKLLNKAWQTIAEAEKILSPYEEIIISKKSSAQRHLTQEAGQVDSAGLKKDVNDLFGEYQKRERDATAGIETAPAAPEENQALQELQPELAKLPEEEREKLGFGLNNFGFFIKEKTNGFLANTFKWLADKKRTSAKDKESPPGTAERFLTALSESYKNDSQDARKKMEDIATGQKRTLGNVGYITGNIMKHGRTVADFVGWTAASPLRYVTISGQILGRGLDVAKEARLKNDQVLEKTRIHDIDAAAEEAWRIYDQAQIKAGEKEVSVKDLAKAYQENIPQDLIKRLKENAEPNEASSFLQGIFKKHIEFSTNLLQSKIDKIEADAKLTEPDKTSQKEKLLNNYSKLLNDFDRVLSQYGTVDTAAMLAQYGSAGAKWAVRGVMVESLYLGLEKLWDGKIWHDLARVVHGQLESSPMPGAIDLAALNKAPGQYFAHLDSTLGINSKDGLSAEELEEVRLYAQHVKSAGNSELAQKISEHYKLPAIPVVETATDTTKAGKVESLPTTPKTIEELRGMEPSTTPLPEAPKPTHFENIIDSSKVSGSDSIWKSTKQIFVDHSKELGYKGEPNDAAALDKWAENQTGNMVAEMEKIKGGKLTDLVHGGDKVKIDLDAQGKPHLKFEVDSGLKSGYLEHHDIAPSQASTIQPQESVPTAADTAKTSFDDFKQTYESAKGLEHDQALINYLNETVINPENKIDYPADKINVFVRMFPIKGFAEKIEDLNTPEKIKKTLDIFDQNLQSATKQLINGQLNMRPGEPLFPIADKDQRLFFAEPSDKGKWKLWHLNIENKYEAVKLQRRFRGDKDSFDVENLKKVLGYK